MNASSERGMKSAPFSWVPFDSLSLYLSIYNLAVVSLLHDIVFLAEAIL